MITGNTRIIGFAGDPVAQARSPQIMNAIFRRNRIDAVCIPLHVRAGDLERTVRGLQGIRNFDGLIATIPHKFAVAQLADDLGESARVVGVANVMKRGDDTRWVADLFDGIGFVRGLVASGIGIGGRSFRILGAGGAGSAIAAALSQAGAAGITIVDVQTTRAEDLACKLRKLVPGLNIEVGFPGAEPADCDVLVNATPLGMKKTDPLPIDPGSLPAQCIVADIIMKPKTTRLLREAKKRGLRIHFGYHMIDHQIPRFLEFFGFDGPMNNS